jgi:hypothetical protein
MHSRHSRPRLWYRAVATYLGAGTATRANDDDFHVRERIADGLKQGLGLRLRDADTGGPTPASRIVIDPNQLGGNQLPPRNRGGNSFPNRHQR